MSDEAIVDESALTGEPLPVTVHRGGQRPQRGPLATGRSFELRALRPAAESAYAALVRLVEQTEEQRAPFVRMADRYAIFLPAGDDAGRRCSPGLYLRRSRARARRLRRRHPVSADSGRADRAHVRPLTRGTSGRRRQGLLRPSSGSARRARCCSTRPARSPSATPNSTASSRPTASPPTQSAPPCRLARPTLLTPAGEGARRSAPTNTISR